MESGRDPVFFFRGPLEVTKKHQEIVARGFESLLQPWLLGLQNCGDGGCGGGIFPFAKSCLLIRPYVVGVALGGEG